MAYIDQAQLATDSDFVRRVAACCTEQAESFRSDTRPDFVALANDVLRGTGTEAFVFVRLIASAPGIADKAATEDGIDSSKVTDDDLLSTVQANWQVVAGLFYGEDGAPIAT